MTGQGTVSVSGAIERGDSRKLSRVLGEHVGQKGYGISLLLNSEGGDLEEALKLADVIREKELGTEVEPKGRCMAECALMFMAGTSETTIGAQTSRGMSRTAVIGFRPPRADSDTGYAAAVSKILRLASQRNSGQHPLIDVALLREMMSTIGNDFYYIDTVGKASEFNIEIIDAAGPPAIAKIEAKQACENKIAFLADAPEADSFSSYSGDGEREAKDEGGLKSEVYSFRWVKGWCRVWDGGPGERGVDAVDHYEEDSPIHSSGDPEWSFWPGSKLLRALPPKTD